jgi:TRAP-type C4-dicarboxylate transport system substrate-binding protein
VTLQRYLLLSCLALGACSQSSDQVPAGEAKAAPPQILKASHQWPGGKGDVRDEMVQLLAREVSAAGVGLEIRVYPNQSLFKAKEQWGAIVDNRLDITALPLDYASGRQPLFSATLMPGLIRSHERARRLNSSAFMQDIKQLIEEAGAVVLADAWLAGGFASSKTCITDPASIKGQVTRAAGPAFEQMLVGAGASIASMPSSEIYTAMQTGVLDAANTSSGSFLSYRLFEQVKCLTAPGANALWMMYEPILISKQRWDGLTPAQQAALRAAGDKAEAYFEEQAQQIDKNMVDKFKEAGVQVVEMSPEHYAAWLSIAKATSYQEFAKQAEGGAALIEKALAVE